MVTERFTRLRRAAAEPVSAASLVAYRWTFGLLMAVGMLRFIAAGWVDAFYVEPEITLGYPGLEWIVPWPRAGMYAHVAALAGLALLLAAGVATRVVALLFAAGFTWLELLDQTCYLNHYYLVTLLALLLAALPPGRGRGTVPRAWLWVMRAQVGMVYVFAGLAKLRWDWLVEAQPLEIWMSSIELPGVGALGAYPWLPHLASWTGAAFDLVIVPLLLWPRTRRPAFASLVGFHVLTWAMFPIGLFPWIMIANATLFFAPDWPLVSRSLHAWWSRTRTSVSGHPPRWRRRILTFALGAHLIVQLALPLRHLLYPGDMLWTEQGLRFAWHVMIVEKAGIARFEVHDPSSRQRWIVYPRELLTPRQEKMLAVQPELIRQLAHRLARRFAEEGIPRVEVYADVEVAWNGRRRARLIDPSVDLAREPFSWHSYAWILPAPPAR